MNNVKKDRRMQQTKYDIFISYKRRDKKKVFELKDYIEKSVGINCWIDLDGIESDAQFINVIIKAINEAQVFLFMYSSFHAEIDDYDTDWTVREINFAQMKRKRIVFLNIDNTDLTDWFAFMFGTKQRIDAFSTDAMQKLCKDLRKWLKIEGGDISDKQDIIKEGNAQKENIEIDAEGLYQEGLWYVNTFPDYKKAIDYLEPAARVGHIKAQNLLGLLLCKEKNYSQAMLWIKKSAEQGDSNAQYNLGKLYYKGYLGKVDYYEALKWFLEAANKSNDEANNMLGVLYEEGKGVTQNYNTAYDYYLIAAKAGNAAAQYNIGCLIAHNKITHYKLNKTDAIMWFKSAAKQGDKEAEAELKKLRRYM